MRPVRVGPGVIPHGGIDEELTMAWTPEERSIIDLLHGDIKRGNAQQDALVTKFDLLEDDVRTMYAEHRARTEREDYVLKQFEIVRLAIGGKDGRGGIVADVADNTHDLQFLRGLVQWFVLPVLSGSVLFFVGLLITKTVVVFP